MSTCNAVPDPNSYYKLRSSPQCAMCIVNRAIVSVSFVLQYCDNFKDNFKINYVNYQYQLPKINTVVCIVQLIATRTVARYNHH